MTQAEDKRSQILVYVGGLLVLVALVLFGLWRRDPVEVEVKQIVGQLGPYPHYDEKERALVRSLHRLGPKAYPALARLLRGRDTRWDAIYSRYRMKLPAVVIRLLPNPPSKSDLSQRVKPLVRELGPVAARALLPAVRDVLARENQDPIGDAELLRSLYWSIPESPLAVATLDRVLSDLNPRRMLFGMKDADDIWPKVPQLGPRLLPWLRMPDQVRDAAQGLGVMGPQAAFAVPDLLEVAERGVAGNPPNTHFLIQGPPSHDPLVWNRAEAIDALGKIGQADPKVLDLLAQAWADPHPMIRAMAASAIEQFGGRALPVFPKLLAHASVETNRSVLEYEVEALGRMGSGARDAVPFLRHWLDQAAINALPAPEPLQRVIRWFEDPLPLRAGAAAALAQINPDPANTVGLGQVVAATLVTRPGQSPAFYREPERIRRLAPLAREIIPELESSFADDRQWVRQLAAFQTLCLDSSHAGARDVLQKGMTEGIPSLRAQAAFYLWRSTGETNATLATLDKSLQTVRTSDDQGPVNYTADFGPAARSLARTVLPLLTNDDQTIRQLAGKALRRIDPEALPPIPRR